MTSPSDVTYRLNTHRFARQITQVPVLVTPAVRLLDSMTQKGVSVVGFSSCLPVTHSPTLAHCLAAVLRFDVQYMLPKLLTVRW